MQESKKRTKENSDAKIIQIELSSFEIQIFFGTELDQPHSIKSVHIMFEYLLKLYEKK